MANSKDLLKTALFLLRLLSLWVSLPFSIIPGLDFFDSLILYLSFDTW